MATRILSIQIETDLGFCKNGYSYVLVTCKAHCFDHVRQYDPNGKDMGMYCSPSAWDRTMHQCIVTLPAE
jgi:hypothetical protein